LNVLALAQNHISPEQSPGTRYGRLEDAIKFHIVGRLHGRIFHSIIRLNEESANLLDSTE
jgi:hypothetical protein